MALENTSRKVIRMVFNTSDGKTHVLEFNNPKDGLTTDDVQNAMNTIITKNIIQTRSGATLTGIKDGGVVERTYTDLIP